MRYAMLLPLSAMAGLALHYQKNETAKTTPIASACKSCACRRKNWLLNRMREQVRFSKF
jgi:hypothetical protein